MSKLIIKIDNVSDMPAEELSKVIKTIDKFINNKDKDASRALILDKSVFDLEVIEIPNDTQGIITA